MVKVKICGITNSSDALYAVGLGADYLGFNFYKKSQRKVSVDMAKEIITKLPPVAAPVGIFVNEEINIIFEIVQKCGLKLVQLHGNESPEYCQSLAVSLSQSTQSPVTGKESVETEPKPKLTCESGQKQLVVDPDIKTNPDQTETTALTAQVITPLPKGHIPIIKAFRIKGPGTIKYLSRYKQFVDYFLLDTYLPGEPGGTGETFNWELAVKAKEYGKPVFLAGGLTPENVADAIKQVQPYAVDVATGVERLPRRKDYDKMKQFITIVKKI